MTKIRDRYASAVHSSNLKSEAATYRSDSDVLGAYGFAGKAVLHNGKPGNPLAVALERLFAGDNKAAREIVEIMAKMSCNKAEQMNLKPKFSWTAGQDMARMVLAWHRDGTCKPCGGHGRELIVGTLTVGNVECKHCHGTKKIPFEKQFKPEHRILARWLNTHIEQEQSKAGPAAMKALAPMLDL